MPLIIDIMPNLAPDQRLVVVLAYDGLATFEFGIAVEVFGLKRPEMGEEWYRFAVAAVDDGPLRATGGVQILADGGLDLLAQAGTVIVPGWRGADVPVPDHLIQALQDAHQRGARLMSICSGVFVLAATGLLNGKQATTHWRYAAKLQAAYPDIRVSPDVLYVDNGQILTSAGSAAGIDLALHLVRRDFGAEAANKVARRLVVPPHRDGGQAQFVERAVPVPHERQRISPLLDRLRGDLSQSTTAAEMAEEAGMSLRTFLRRFKAATGTTPADWLVQERLAKAKELLETTAFSVDEIAAHTGFGSAATLRHHFQAQLATTPTGYRQRFSRSA